uniref:Uncharacterized protein n=1 Tax=Nothoprocta perdicaria TaxID=30464 RepID=A0A8C6YRR7_NOTPE
TMQDQRADINQQIQELRTIISLQGDAPLASVGCPHTCGLCCGTLGSRLGLRGLHWAAVGLPLPSGCLVTLPCSPASPRVCFQMAREKLQNDVFDRVNVCNMLLYELRQRDRALEELQRQLHSLQWPHGGFNPASSQLSQESQEPSLMQMIRQLENNIEKTLMKVRTGQKVTTLYLAVRDVLKKELAHLPLRLNVLDRMVEVYQGELKGMELMALDAFKATDTAKVRPRPRTPLPGARAHGDPAWTALGSQAIDSSCNQV